MEHGIVILGAGHGGSQVGFSLRQEGYAGPIHLISEEAELPYHKPPLSKAFLKTATEGPQILRAEKAYHDARITLDLGRRVDAIDRVGRRLLLTDGRHVAYDHFVIATGASNRRLTVPGHDLVGVHAIRTLAEAGALRQALASANEIVVIGGGFIGLEAAASFAALGKRVTLVEMAPVILGRAVSPIVAAHVDRIYRELGIRIVTGASITQIHGTGGRVQQVELASGEQLSANLVLVGIGATANDGLARAAGIACDNGITVDGELRTDDPAIFAIGDVAHFPHAASGRRVRLESVQNAADQAKHVARLIAGKAPGAYRDVPWFWSDQGPVRLQMAGLSHGADRQLIVGDPDGDAFSVYHFAANRLLSVDSVNRSSDHMLARQLLTRGLTPSEDDLHAGPEAVKAFLARQ